MCCTFNSFIHLFLLSCFGTANKIGDEGAKALAKALETNTTLEKMCLTVNKIGDEGAKALADALSMNTSLKMLTLGKNKIGDKSVTKLFAEALKTKNNFYLRTNVNFDGESGDFRLKMNFVSSK